MKRFFSTLLILVATACPSLAQSEQESNEVLALETELKQALVGKDTAKFLSWIGPSGVVFGVDGDNQFKGQVQEQFDQKRDAYCVLFDSKCLSKETPHKRLALPPCSVHDLLRRAEGWNVQTQAAQAGGASQVHLILKPNEDSCSNGKDSVEFVFVQVGDGWNLVGVGYE